MAQVITNTFFDDCEAIVNENGRPVIKNKVFNAIPNESNAITKAEMLQLGFSNSVLDGYPYTLLGVFIEVEAKGASAGQVTGLAQITCAGDRFYSQASVPRGQIAMAVVVSPDVTTYAGICRTYDGKYYRQ